MKKLFLLAACGLLLVGCVRVTNSSKKQPVVVLPINGIFKTVDQGQTWFQRGNVYTLDGTKAVVPDLNVTAMVPDPSDANTVYLASDKGIYYTYNRGDGWNSTLATEGVVNSIAVDPNSRCVLYAAAHNKFFKSVDCARSWQKTHFTTLADEFYTAIYIPRANSNVIFLATSKGTLERSDDAGQSWQVQTFFRDAITGFIDNPSSSTIFYAVQHNDIQETTDAGATWTTLFSLPVHAADAATDIGKAAAGITLAEISGSRTIYDVKYDASQGDGLIYASGYGIFRLVNREYWQEIEVLNKPQEQAVYSIAIDGHTGTDLYFTTTGAFYRSANAGKEWSVRDLPATGVPKFLYLFPDRADELMAIFYSPKNK